jgi:hypothetical protein
LAYHLIRNGIFNLAYDRLLKANATPDNSYHEKAAILSIIALIYYKLKKFSEAKRISEDCWRLFSERDHIKTKA